MVNKKTIILSIVALVLSVGALFINQQKPLTAKTIYKVYLDGKEIGNIKSKKELETYIDNSQNEVKKKYNVSGVFMPNNLYIKKAKSYFTKIDKVEKIYEKIQKESPFTIEAYEITIKGLESMTEEGAVYTKARKVYSVKQEVFDKALEKTIFAFVDEEEYEDYINETQEEIKDYGRRTDKINIKNNITVKKTKVSTSEEIFLDVDSLSQYLLFGSLDATNDYIVQEGDNVNDVSFNNKLSSKELMIANPEITSVDNLLYTGQKLNVAMIDPMFILERSELVIERQAKAFETIIEQDPNLSEGVQKVKQEGVNGISKVTSKYKYVNGQLEDTEVISEEQIQAPTNRIVVQGTKYIPNVGNIGVWAWPTNQYTITSPYGWRWGKIHEAIDISGPLGSPIYAANNGTVIEAASRWPNGNYVIIDHNNGYTTVYAHMSSFSVSVGQTVAIGERIGSMGSTGFATGVHLHFGTFVGKPFSGKSFNPMTLYK